MKCSTLPPVGPAVLPATPGVQDDAVQRVVKVRRDYNAWVARETMEDYALRFAPRSFRKWSESRVANNALQAHWVLPSVVQLTALQEVVALGYLRGIQRKLDEIEGENAAPGSFVAHLRGPARDFQLDALGALIAQSIHDRQPS